MTISQTPSNLFNNIDFYQQDSLNQAASSSSFLPLQQPAAAQVTPIAYKKKREPSKLKTQTLINRFVKIIRTGGPSRKEEPLSKEGIPLLEFIFEKPSRSIRTNLTQALFSVRAQWAYTRIYETTDNQDLNWAPTFAGLIKIQAHNALIGAQAIKSEIYPFKPVAQRGTPPFKTVIQHDPISSQSQDSLLSTRE